LFSYSGIIFELSNGFFWRTPTEFCWPRSFAGMTFTSKTTQAKIKMRQQNIRGASKIIHPNNFDIPHKKKACKNVVAKLGVMCLV
jgi:hypothetical protein